MPICFKCKEDLPRSSFYDGKTAGHSSYCKACCVIAAKERRANWTEEQWEKERARKREQKRIHYEAELLRVRRKQKKLRDHIDQYKADHGCAHCNDYEVDDLEFHHIDPSEKELTMSQCRSFAQFERESKKCIVLCFSCHNKAHGRTTTKKPRKARRKTPSSTPDVV